MRNRQGWLLLAAIITVGVLSRTIHTGFSITDKYLGDALYAAMFYVIFRLAHVQRPTLYASLTMLALELFQLTHIPAQLLTTNSTPLHLLARLLGTQFSPYDLLAYAIGIATLTCFDPPPRATS